MTGHTERSGNLGKTVAVILVLCAAGIVGLYWIKPGLFDGSEKSRGQQVASPEPTLPEGERRTTTKAKVRLRIIEVLLQNDGEDVPHLKEHSRYYSLHVYDCIHGAFTYLEQGAWVAEYGLDGPRDSMDRAAGCRHAQEMISDLRRLDSAPDGGTLVVLSKANPQACLTHSTFLWIAQEIESNGLGSRKPPTGFFEEAGKIMDEWSESDVTVPHAFKYLLAQQNEDLSDTKVRNELRTLAGN